MLVDLICPTEGSTAPSLYFACSKFKKNLPVSTSVFHICYTRPEDFAETFPYAALFYARQQQLPSHLSLTMSDIHGPVHKEPVV